ncbi:MAG: 4Fe-4S dicluster domain-containing protein [Vulcanisaeta sp.]
MSIDPSIRQEITNYEPTLTLCFQCGTCTSVCPVTDYGMNTRLLMKKLNLGIIDDWVRKTVWLCLGCGLCRENCPNKINIPNVIRFVRSLELAEIRRRR